MSKSIEEISVVWSGPHSIEKVAAQIKDPDQDLGLYQIYGYHPIYGSNVLLYIGRTNDFATRSNSHALGWLESNQDPDSVKIYLGRLAGETPSRATWDRQIDLTEKLLIYTHFPAGNSSSLNKMTPACENIRVFNFGSFRSLMPEVSGARWKESLRIPDPYSMKMRKAG